MLLLGVLAAQAAGVAPAPVAASDFELIETQTLGSAVASVTFDVTGLGSTYDHLQIRFVAKTNRTSADVDFLDWTVNSDTSSNYSWHFLMGDGSSVSAAAASNASVMRFPRVAGNSGTEIYGSGVVDFLDAFDDSKYLTARALGAGVSGNKQLTFSSGSWRNTDALTTISVEPELGTSILANSRFSIYGWKAA